MSGRVHLVTMSLSVIIPSMPSRHKMLREAIRSVYNQEPAQEVEVIVGIEQDAAAHDISGIDHFVGGSSQVTKVNAGVAAASHDVIAFLHDDDLWHPEFLKHALYVLEDCDFVSSTALEVDEEGHIIGMIDCAVPSSWVMRKWVWDEVGPFDEKYRWHCDSEWLGRLGETKDVRRSHLVDALHPEPRIKIGGETIFNELMNRPLFREFLAAAKPLPRLARHQLPVPLVTHRQHGGAIMQRINDPDRLMQSQWEHYRMTQRFARIPW